MVPLFAYFYLAAIVLQPAVWVSMFYNKPVVEIILLLGFIFTIFTRFDRLKIILGSPQVKYFTGYIIISIISLHKEGMAYAIGEVGVTYFKYFLGYILLMAAFDDDKRLNNGLFVIVISGVIVSYYCIQLSQTGVGVGLGIEVQKLNWRNATQWIGTFGGSNTTAQLLLFILSIALGLLYKQFAFFKKYFLVISIGYIGYAFFLTHSRGGTLGLLAVLSYILYLKLKIRLKYFVPAALVFAGVMFALLPQEEGRGIAQSSTPERIDLLYQGLQMIKEHPLLGVGSGQFYQNNTIRKTAHNIYLNTFAEIGIFGFFMFVMMYYVAIRELLKLNRDGSSGELSKRNILAVSFALISAMVANFFLSAQHEIPYILLALITIPSFNKGVSYKANIKEYQYILGFIIAIVVIVHFLVELFFKIFG